MDTAPKWLEPFSPAFREAVLAELNRAGDAKLACFDADGTLWSEDIGEALFRWLSAGALLPGIDKARDPFEVWHEYEERVKRNRTEGYSWAVQVMAGLEESDLRRWCRQMAIAWPTYRPAMAGLVSGLTRSGFEVWLVSASNFWIIEAGAAVFGADRSRVMGIRVEVEGGKLTDKLVRPVTCNAGKVDAIRQRLGRNPDLAVGDSMGDLEMLQSARVPLVVGRNDKPAAELPAFAAKKGWAVSLF